MVPNLCKAFRVWTRQGWNSTIQGVLMVLTKYFGGTMIKVVSTKSIQVTVIYIALFRTQIVSKQLYSIKQGNNVSIVCCSPLAR